MEQSVSSNVETSQSEFIGLRGNTQRSETSQYLEEKKSREIL